MSRTSRSLIRHSSITLAPTSLIQVPTLVAMRSNGSLWFLESFRDLRFDVLELIDAGGDRVIVSTTMHGRGAASGASVDDTYVFVYELRDGLVVEGWEYRTRQEALEAAGLEE